MKGVLSLLVCTLLVGSGFSAWYFTGGANYNKDASIAGNISVTPLVEPGSSLLIKAGETTLYDSAEENAADLSALKITLDQGTPQGNTDVTKLIYFNDTPATTSQTLTITYTISADIDAEAASAAEKAEALALVNGKTVTLTYSNTIGSGLSTYIVSTGTTNGTVTGTDTPAAEGNDFTRTVSYTVNVSFNYAEDQKPTSKETYNTMKTAVQGTQYTLAFAITAVDPAPEE